MPESLPNESQGQPHGLARRLALRPETALILALILISLVFLAMPGLDLAVSGAFTDAGHRFPLSRNPSLGVLRDLGNRLTLLVVLAALAALLVPILSPLRRFILNAHQAAYVLAVYAIGPGLIVNAIMKETFGRPRPANLVDFGGKLEFSPIWSIGGGCLKNCSFVAGEGAAAAALLCLVFVVPRRYRMAASCALAIVAAAISVNRIAFGGHFLSDVLLSWVIVLLVAVALRPLFFGERGVVIDAWFRRWSLFRARKV